MPKRKRTYESTEREFIHDKPDPSRPERPCACCGRRFQPTTRRRMLCAECFTGNDAQWRRGYDPVIPSDGEHAW